VASGYSDPRAHALRERYVRMFGGPELPVPVESIAEDLLGLRIEERELEWSGLLLPAERTIGHTRETRRPVLPRFTYCTEGASCPVEGSPRP